MSYTWLSPAPTQQSAHHLTYCVCELVSDEFAHQGNCCGSFLPNLEREVWIWRPEEEESRTQENWQKQKGQGQGQVEGRKVKQERDGL